MLSQGLVVVGYKHTRQVLHTLREDWVKNAIRLV